MAAKWKSGYDPSVIIGKLDKIRDLDGEKLSFKGFRYDEYITLIQSMIEIDDDISTETSNGIVISGVHEAAKKQKFIKNNVIIEINKLLNEHLNKPDQCYKLVSTLNIKNTNSLPRYTINGCVLNFYPYLPKKYWNARQSVISDVSGWLIKKDEDFSQYLIAQTKAKSVFDAVDRILEAVDLLRGIWNLHINKSMVITFGTGRKRPINEVVLGPLQTVHSEDGAKASGGYWYSPDYYEGQSKVDLGKPSSKTLEFTNNVRKCLKKSNYQKTIESGIVRYVRALDLKDYNSSFIQLWSVLEYLTNSNFSLSAGTPLEVAGKRATLRL